MGWTSSESTTLTSTSAPSSSIAPSTLSSLSSPSSTSRSSGSRSSSSSSTASTTSSSGSTYWGEITQSTASTSTSGTTSSTSSTSTSTTMTWGIVQGQAAFAAGGVSASGVRSACLYAVSEATNVAEEQVQGILEYPSDTRRLLQWHTDYTNVRRLTSMQEAAEVWTMTFTIEVPSMMVADIELSLRMIETNAENKTSEFSEILLRALLLSAKNGTTLSGSFRFLMLVFEDPQGTIDGFQQSVTAKEAAVLGVLLEGNATEVILQIDGVVAVASRVSSEEIMEAGSWTIGQTEEDGFAAVLPATTFGSLERQGIDVSEVVFVAMNLGTAVNSFVGLNDTFMGRDVIVRGSINMNLYD
eukprot:4157833-Amphidinium_carterae.1